MRGRLIVPFIAELAQLDTIGTAADPDGGGPLVSGYDSDFREPVIAGPAPGAARRVGKAAIRVPFQVETETYDSLQQMFSGPNTDRRIILVFHFRDLENMGLVDPTSGEALIRLNDRLIAIREHTAAQALIQQVRTPPGLYATEVVPASFGLSGGKRNLLLVTFEEREKARGGG